MNDKNKTALREAFEAALAKAAQARTPLTGKVYRAVQSYSGYKKA